MNCEKCGKNEASVFVRQNINGKTSEHHLCASCAGSIINTGGAQLTGFDMANPIGYLTNVFPQIKYNAAPPTRACPVCGTSLGEILHKGKVGCSECYRAFKSELLPTLSSIHGNVNHIGKIPQNLNTKISAKRKIENLQAKLRDKILEQDFEEAAKLRDEIKQLTQEATQ